MTNYPLSRRSKNSDGDALIIAGFAIIVAKFEIIIAKPAIRKVSRSDSCSFPISYY